MNTIGDACDDPKDEQCIKIKAWIDKNFEWMYSQINENQVDPYWHHVIISKFYSLYKNARTVSNSYSHRLHLFWNNSSVWHMDITETTLEH